MVNPESFPLLYHMPLQMAQLYHLPMKKEVSAPCTPLPVRTRKSTRVLGVDRYNGDEALVPTISPKPHVSDAIKVVQEQAISGS